MERFDVAVVGAGPAGSSATILLQRQGYSVVLLDKRTFPREKLCGDFLNPVNWPLLEQLSVANKLLSFPHEEITAFRITASSGEEVTVRFPLQKGKPLSGLGVRRYYLDDLLLKQAVEEGAVVRQGSRVMDLKRESGGWAITLADRSTERRLSAAFLIGADGRNSYVAERLGLAQAALNSAEFLAFQTHVRGARGPVGNVEIHLFPGGYAGVVGVGEGMMNLCFAVERKKVNGGFPDEFFLANHLCQNPHLREVLEEGRVVGDVRSAFPLSFPPRRSYGNGFLLVGDAALVTEPVTGEGVYFALQSGLLAAEAIHLAFAKADFSARQLSSYRWACRKAFFPRRSANSLIRALIHRPSLLPPLIRLSSGISFPVGPLVNLVCGRD